MGEKGPGISFSDDQWALKLYSEFGIKSLIDTHSVALNGTAAVSRQDAKRSHLVLKTSKWLFSPSLAAMQVTSIEDYQEFSGSLELHAMEGEMEKEKLINIIVNQKTVT